MFERDPFRDLEPLMKRVYAYVAYRIGDGPHAEDVVGDTFERALRYRSTYDPAKGQPIAWLIGIARRCLQEAFQPPAASTEDLPELTAPDDTEREVVSRLDLAAAVARLGSRDRELVALRYGADLSARQIAEQLDMQTNAVEVALHRALAQLRAILERSDSAAKALVPSCRE
jgi:RNA polymerase sigma-70 factor (ECF subfamily)